MSEMSEMSTAQSAPVEVVDPRAEYYGDEQQRLEALRQLDFPTFKQALIDAHNSHPDIDIEEQFTSRQNMMSDGTLFPKPLEKDSLMAYALEQAQQQDDVQISALILGTAIVVVHPFLDGNGRTSRSVYAYLSRGLNPGMAEFDALHFGYDRRGSVDFGDITGTHVGAIERIIYLESGVKKLAPQAWSISEDPEVAKQHYAEREFHGLQPEEVEELDMLLGEKYGNEEDGYVGRYSGSDDAVIFGFSKLEQDLNLGIDVITTKAGHTQFNVPDSLAAMDGDTKRMLIKNIYEFNRLKAKAAIDAFSVYGNHIFPSEHGSMTLRSYLLTHSRNYLALRKNKRLP